MSAHRSTVEWSSVTFLTGEQGSTRPVSGRPGRSSDQAGRGIPNLGVRWTNAPVRTLESARKLSRRPARLSWMPVPGTPMRPRPDPGKNSLHQRCCGFPAAWWNSTHSISYRFIQMLPPSKPSGYPLRNASLVLAERNTYGRSIVSFRSSHMRVPELPTQYALGCQNKRCLFLPFPGVLVLGFASIMRRQLPVSSGSCEVSHGNPRTTTDASSRPCTYPEKRNRIPSFLCPALTGISRCLISS